MPTTVSQPAAETAGAMPQANGAKSWRPKATRLGERLQTLGVRLLSANGTVMGPDATSGGAKIGVTSCRRREGVSTVAANLAVSAAQPDGARVLVVDANVAHPALHQMFGVAPAPGLLDVLAGTVPLPQAIQATAVAHVDCLAAGSSPENHLTASAPEDGRPIFSPAKVAGLLTLLAGDYDLLILDLPAAEAAPQAMNLAARLDGLLLVVEAERTSREMAAQRKQQLTDLGANLLGVVLNKTRS